MAFWVYSAGLFGENFWFQDGLHDYNVPCAPPTPPVLHPYSSPHRQYKKDSFFKLGEAKKQVPRRHGVNKRVAHGIDTRRMPCLICVVSCLLHFRIFASPAIAMTAKCMPSQNLILDNILLQFIQAWDLDFLSHILGFVFLLPVMWALNFPGAS